MGYELNLQTSSDCIFDAAFNMAERDLPLFLNSKPYTGEFVAAGALRVVADILAGIVSPCPATQLQARQRLDQLLLGKELS